MFSTTSMAETIGCNRSTVERWETGKKMPPADKLGAYLRVLTGRGFPKEEAARIFNIAYPHLTLFPHEPAIEERGSSRMRAREVEASEFKFPIPQEICTTDQRTSARLSLARQRSPLKVSFGIDGCFELLHSPSYSGWEDEEFKVHLRNRATDLPAELTLLCEENRPNPPNNPKWRLAGLIPHSSEGPMRLTLAPTSYFMIKPIQDQLRRAGESRALLKKYGDQFLQFENFKVPSCMFSDIIVVLQNKRVLLCQRPRHRGLDWSPGLWGASISEQMSGPPQPDTTQDKRIDRDLFDTVKAGVREELLDDTAKIENHQIKMLSIILDCLTFSVGVIALVDLEMTLDQVKQYLPSDGSAEVLRYSEIDWTVEALAPILFRRDVRLFDDKINSTEWDHLSRMKILVSLYYKYGVNEARRRLEALRSFSEIS